MKRNGSEYSYVFVRFIRLSNDLSLSD